MNLEDGQPAEQRNLSPSVERFRDGVGTQRIAPNGALAFLQTVQDTLHDQIDKYDMFVSLMTDFHLKRIDTNLVISGVNELFKGHPDLIRGFNSFMPKVMSKGRETVEFQEVITFVNKIKKRFENDVQVYGSFIDTLNQYRRAHKSLNEVFSEVASLFTHHPDLLDEFTRFMPKSSAVASEKTEELQELEEAINMIISCKI